MENCDLDYVPRVVENHVQLAIIEANGIAINKLWEVVGFLSNWASYNPNYKFVIICHDTTNGDLIANYYKEMSEVGKGRPRYQMGAIWRSEQKTYTFHS